MLTRSNAHLARNMYPVTEQATAQRYLHTREENCENDEWQ